LAKQGLDLGNFSADAHGESDDSQSSDEPGTKLNQTENSTAESAGETLAKEGSSARLINRIV
jgi:hypothetical protein